ncbi:hypothetical protein BSKO_03772 [Bryopsis sp. KO-2023]|nr:hypothetical protein BSKO_03772 [Bryopsis sp. KO-2023]
MKKSWDLCRALALASVFSRGGATQQAIRVFLTVDKEGRGFIDQQKMIRALADLGVLEKMKATTLGRFMTKELKTLGIAKDGLVSLEQFVLAFETLARFQARAEKNNWQSIRSTLPQVPPGYEANSTLKRCFRYFCGANSTSGGGKRPNDYKLMINGERFAKICMDAGLVEPEGQLPPFAVDIVFTRCKPGGDRYLPYRQFLIALASLAQEAGLTFEEVVSRLGCRNTNAQVAMETSRSRRARHATVAGIQQEMSTHKSRLMSRLQQLESLLGAPKGARSLASDPNTPAEPVDIQERLSTARGTFVLQPDPAKSINVSKIASVVVDEVHEQMESMKNALVQAVDEQFKSLQGRLQAGEQARSYVNEVRLQDMGSRTAQLEAQTRGLQSVATAQERATHTEDVVAALSNRVASMEHLKDVSTGLKTRIGIMEEAVNKLSARRNDAENRLQDRSPSVEAASELDHKGNIRARKQKEPSSDRWEARVESMLRQVVGRVDQLEAKIQEEQQLTLRAFEAILKGQQNRSTQN